MFSHSQSVHFPLNMRKMRYYSLVRSVVCLNVHVSNNNNKKILKLQLLLKNCKTSNFIFFSLKKICRKQIMYVQLPTPNFTTTTQIFKRQ